MMTALDIQSALLQAEMAGQPYTITRNGKPQQPRPFWIATSTGLLFTPRFGNEFLFAKGQGVMAKDRSALAELLNDFGSAITAGEFDARLMEISRNRGPGRQGGGGWRADQGRQASFSPFSLVTVGLLDNLGEVGGRREGERYLVESQWRVAQPATRLAIYTS